MVSVPAPPGDCQRLLRVLLCSFCPEVPADRIPSGWSWKHSFHPRWWMGHHGVAGGRSCCESQAAELEFSCAGKATVFQPKIQNILGQMHLFFEDLFATTEAVHPSSMVRSQRHPTDSKSLWARAEEALPSPLRPWSCLLHLWVPRAGTQQTLMHVA